jgi:hypothetical protein
VTAPRRRTGSAPHEEHAMPRYMVQRTFPDGLAIPADASGRQVCATVVDKNLDHRVTWVHSYVSDDKRSTFCIYDAPTPEAIRKAAADNGLPVDSITQVAVLDPYFSH